MSHVTLEFKGRIDRIADPTRLISKGKGEYREVGILKSAYLNKKSYLLTEVRSYIVIHYYYTNWSVFV